MRVLLVLLGALALTPAAAAGPGWLAYGNGPERTGFTDASFTGGTAWFVPLEGRVTSQALVLLDEPGPGERTIVVGTSAGRVYGLAGDGWIRWEADVGRLANACPQLDGYGVTGTPVADPDGRLVYVADAFGLLHALDAATGEERAGWPVRLFRDPSHELVWGALSLVGGRVYAPTGSYCDEGPFEGKLVAVDTATRAVSSWTSVPLALGGGGGIWGWGGVAYDGDSLFAVTGNAFRGGTNVGSSFTESAGYGDQLVQLGPDLDVRSAGGPPDLAKEDDVDLVGSPVVLRRPGCGELVAAVAKNGRLYGWWADALGEEPSWSIAVQPPDPGDPLLSQPAVSPTLDSIYVATGTGLVRVAVGAGCLPSVAWSLPLGTRTLNGSPTVSGGTVWLAVSRAPALLLGFDAVTGAQVARNVLGGTAVAAPAIAGGELVLGSFDGGLHGLGGRPSGAAAPARPEEQSWLDARHGWESRESGVYATDDGGRHWRRIYPFPALRVVRTSARAGMIATGFPAPACGCRTRRLWTTDGGAHWHPTDRLGDLVAGRGRLLYTVAGAGIEQVAWPPAGDALHTRTVARVPIASIVALAPAPGGTVALLSGRDTGRDDDDAPRLLIVRGGGVRRLVLPRRGTILAASLTVAWPRITVAGTDFAGGGGVAWRSTDGGASWRVGPAAPSG